MAIEHMPININFYFSFDLKIILKTFKKVFKREGVVH